MACGTFCNVCVSGNINAAGNIYGSVNLSVAGNIYGNISNATGLPPPSYGFQIAIGQCAGSSCQHGPAIAIGCNAGHCSQGQNPNCQPGGAIAIGYQAGQQFQGCSSIGIGSQAGALFQNNCSVAIGSRAGQSAQQSNAIAIGTQAGYTGQGPYAIAVGAYSGHCSQANNSIILNATGNILNGSSANALYIAPIRYDTANTANVLYYNISTKEITYACLACTTYTNASVAAYLSSGNLANNILTTANISATGNIYGGNFITSGSGGNISGANVINTITLSATGNIYSNVFIGNGAGLTNLVGANVNGCVANATYATSAGSAASAVTVTGNVTASQVIGNVANATYATSAGSATSAVTVTGNVTASQVIGNVANATYATSAGSAGTATSAITVTGNVTASQVIGNVANATFAASAVTVTGNAQPNITSVGTLGNLTVSGNIHGGYLYGCGANITGLAASYGNANVTALLSSGAVTTDYKTTGNVSASGHVYAGSVSVSGVINIANTVGNVLSTAGNISAGYLYGNGAFLTGISGGGGGSYGNSNVAAYLPTDPTIVSIENSVANTSSNLNNLTISVAGITSNVTSLTGTVGNTNTNLYNLTVSVSGITSNVTSLTGTINNTNSNVSSLTTTVNNLGTSVTILETQVTSLSGNIYGNTNVANYLPTYSGNLGSVNSITAVGNILIGQNATILGNLSVHGNVTYSNANVITTNNLYIALANNQSTYAGINGSGIHIGQGNLINLTYNYIGNTWSTNAGISTTGNIIAPVFFGCGGHLANINGANISGLTATYAATVTNNAQPNITSVGVLNTLSVFGTTSTWDLAAGGAISADGNVHGNYIIGDGSLLTNINGGGITSRIIATGTTGMLNPNAGANITIVGFKGYNLYGIQTSNPAWVTLYTSVATRYADSSRAISVNPTPGTGVIAEAITNSNAMQYFTPGVVGFSTESPPSTNIQLKVVNTGTVPVAITVSLLLVKTES